MIEPLNSAIEQLDSYLENLNTGLNISKYFEIAFPALLAKGACWIVELILLVMVTFVNINVTMWMIEFNFLLVVCAICLPWQIFSPTKFVASGIWQALFGQAIKMFCVVLLVSIAPKLFRAATTSTVESLLISMQAAEGFAYQALLSLIVTTIGLTLTYCYFLMKGPAIAKAIIVGQPTMETLGTHAVTKMGARAIGTAGALLSLPLSVLGHTIGGVFGSLLGRKSSQNPQKNSDSTDVNEGKL